MPEIITTPHALVQTNNGKRFYVNSGVVSVGNSETAVIDITNIGERDIRLNINPMNSTDSTDRMTLRVKNNDLTIYETLYLDRYDTGPATILKFIIPSNTSLAVTFQNSDSTSHSVGVSCYGKFV